MSSVYLSEVCDGTFKHRRYLPGIIVGIRLGHRGGSRLLLTAGSYPTATAAATGRPATSPTAPDPEMKLDIPHNTGIRVGKGQVTNVCTVLFGQLIIAIVNVEVRCVGIRFLNDLTQLKVKGDDGYGVQPGLETGPVRLRR